MRAILLHYSNLCGGDAVLCADAATYMRQRSRAELDTALLSSDAREIRSFWREFQALADRPREQVLTSVGIRLDANAARVVSREEIDTFAFSGTDAAVGATGDYDLVSAVMVANEDSDLTSAIVLSGEDAERSLAGPRQTVEHFQDMSSWRKIEDEKSGARSGRQDNTDANDRRETRGHDE